MTDLDIVAAARPYSMTSDSNLMATVAAVHMIDQGVPGDVVECGVWRGGQIIAAMLASDQNRRYWLFDTFDGMPEPGPQDTRRGAHATESSKYRKLGREWCRAELTEVKQNVDPFVSSSHTVIYVPGVVERTMRHALLPEHIALLRLDTDFYSSTKIELEVLWPRLSPGGVLIVDDYGSWDGCRQACDEYFGSNFEYEVINETAIRKIKQ